MLVLHEPETCGLERIWRAEIAETRAGFVYFGTSCTKYMKNARKTLFFHSQVRYYSPQHSNVRLRLLKEDLWLQE